jgi:hypothetical protein
MICPQLASFSAASGVTVPSLATVRSMAMEIAYAEFMQPDDEVRACVRVCQSMEFA